MIAKTVTSVGMVRWIDGRSGGGGANGITPTKDKREEHLKERGNPFDTGKAYAKCNQRNRRHIRR